MGDVKTANEGKVPLIENDKSLSGEAFLTQSKKTVKDLNKFDDFLSKKLSLKNSSAKTIHTDYLFKSQNGLKPN